VDLTGKWRTSVAPAACARLSVVLLSAGFLVGAAAPVLNGFEAVPEHPPGELLPPQLVKGTDFHVVDPVQGDGLMNRFVLDSRFGQFEAYGRVALVMRIREVAALTELDKKSRVELLTGGVAHGVESEVKAAAGVVTNPIGTVTGIPKGISHLFHGYTARGQETVAQVQRSADSSAGPGGSAHEAAASSERAAKHYAEQYLGVTAAERAWYKRLGVDPYTDNAVLRNAIRHDAKIEAAGSFGAKFIGLPVIPGIAITERVEDAIYNEDPATIRERVRKTLAGYGLSASEIEQWLNAPVLSPTRQVLLLSTAEALTGVAGRAELFRHSLDLTSVAEAQVYLRSVGLLVVAHRAGPLTRLIPGVRLPAAERANGELVVCGAFEAVYWTEGVASDEEQLRTSLPPQGAGSVRQLWLAGTISERARNALREHGWELHEVADTLGAGESSK
jgi:hypothetical protein